MIEIEIYWDDLTEAKQNEIKKALKMSENDNGNWDVIPISILNFNEEVD